MYTYGYTIIKPNFKNVQIQSLKEKVKPGTSQQKKESKTWYLSFNYWLYQSDI